MIMLFITNARLSEIKRPSTDPAREEGELIAITTAIFLFYFAFSLDLTETCRDAGA